MEVVSACPLSAGSIVWRAQSGAVVLTVVAKATFQLASIESRLAEVQDPILVADRYWNDDPRQSLLAPSDLVPWKRRADVLVVGHAFAPYGEPVRSLLARLYVAGADKTVEIFCDRVVTQDGRLRESPRFVKAPLLWHLAAGGPGTGNPAGIPIDAPWDTYGQRLLPRFQPPGLHVTGPGIAIPTIGLGPLAPTWPERWQKLYHHANGWDHLRWYDRPVPDDIDVAYFNAAPPDQQVDLIRPDERIVLENLHPLLSRFVTNLSAPPPQGVVERPGRPTEGVAFVCDTMCIDTDRGVCVLSWRARILLDAPDAPGRVWILMEGQPAAAPQASPVAATAFAGSAPAPYAQPTAGAAPLPYAAQAQPGVPAAPSPPAIPGLASDPFPIDRCAAIAASWARRAADRAAILEENGLTEDDWDALDHRWSEMLRKDAAELRTDRLAVYDRAFVAQLEKERGIITAVEYARLALHEHDRAALTRALKDLALPWGVTQRIQRVFEERMKADPALAERVRAAMKER